MEASGATRSTSLGVVSRLRFEESACRGASWALADHRALFLTSAEEAGSLIVFASEWLELDSPVEGIRFDSELVSSPFRDSRLRALC